MSRYTGPTGARLAPPRHQHLGHQGRDRSPSRSAPTRRASTAAPAAAATPREYLIQLQEKQKARFTYGLSERQFRNLYEEANRRQGVTGENMLQLLELRLDNVVYRAGWAATRPQARQFVGHGHVSVNGKRVNIPSYRVRKGDVVTLRDKAREMIVVQWNLDVLDRRAPAWLETGDDNFQVTVLRAAAARADRRARPRAAHRRALLQVGTARPSAHGRRARRAAAPPRSPRSPVPHHAAKNTESFEVTSPCWSCSVRRSKR